jgi:class 3 adenylate cyclase
MVDGNPDDHFTTLVSYVPALIARRLAADPHPISQPTAERFAAAVLFADISGFTALGERLAQRGLAGSEELAGLLNDYFGRVIDLVSDHGGEVTKFAGDALLALWPVPANTIRLGLVAREALAEATSRAALCALAIQDVLCHYCLADGTPLALQIGIGAGDVSSVHLGGVFNRWEFLLSGSPMVQMSQAKDHARPGTIVLSPEAWTLIQHQASGQPIAGAFVELKTINRPLSPQSAVLPPLPPAAKPGLQAYIPAAVLNRLEAGQANWLSELRRITVMFIKLPSYGTSIKHPYARTLPRAQAVMQALQTSLYRYAGSINKLNVDDKGITLVAAMGLPPLSHKDDAARAVHAALEMQAALKALGRRSAVGITTGWVFCGPIGNGRRREYTMVGNVVNMATRLMQAAEANLIARQGMTDILCDETTFQAIQEQAGKGQLLAGRLTFESLPRLTVKGKVEPILAFRPHQRTVPAPANIQNRKAKITLAGRTAERAFLREQLHALRQPAGNSPATILFVEGEAGIGKSRLVDELVAQARALHLGVLTGAGHALEQTTPYYGWRAIFRQLFDLDLLFNDKAAQRAHVLRHLPSGRDERGFPALALHLSPLLNAVLPLNFPENSTTYNLSAAERQRTTQLFLLRLLQRAVAVNDRKKQPPRLLVLENGQWLDQASWELALAVSQQVQPLLLVVATRPFHEQDGVAPLPPAAHQLLQSATAHWLRLSGLASDEVAALVSQQLGVNEIPAELRTLLQRKAEGHPFYSQELARAWCDSGLIRIAGRDCRLAADVLVLEKSAAPDVLQKAIISRLDRLAPTQQLILKVASVLGRTFTLAALQEIYPLPAGSLPAHLSALVQLDILCPLPPVLAGAEPTYRFKYALVQEVAYNLLPYSQRQQLENRG